MSVSDPLHGLFMSLKVTERCRYELGGDREDCKLPAGRAEPFEFGSNEGKGNDCRYLSGHGRRFGPPVLTVQFRVKRSDSLVVDVKAFFTGASG